MAISAGAFVGRDVLVEFAIADETAIPSSLTYKRLGMMRGKKISTNWDTADTTADQSPAFTKTKLVTFKAVSFEGDGVSYAEAAYNQKEFRAQAISPGAGTAYQPKFWLRVTDADGSTWEGPYIVPKWEDSRPYSDAATWSMSAESNGDVVYTPT